MQCDRCKFYQQSTENGVWENYHCTKGRDDDYYNEDHESCTLKMEV